MDLTQVSFQIQAAEIALSGAAARQQRAVSSATTHRSHDSTTTNGEGDKQRAPSKRLSIRKLGSIFTNDKRTRRSFDGSSNGRSSQLTAIASSNGDAEDANGPIEGGRRSVDIESFGRANGHADKAAKEHTGSQGKTLLLAITASTDIITGRTRVQRGQPVGFDFDDFDTIDEFPEPVSAAATPRRKPQFPDTKRSTTRNGYPDPLAVKSTHDQYEEVGTEPYHANGAALGNGFHHHHHQQGQPQGLDTERSTTRNGYSDHVTVDRIQHQYEEVETEHHHSNGVVLGNGFHYHHQQQGQPHGPETEGHVNGHTEHSVIAAAQYDVQEADTEGYYDHEAQDPEDTTPSDGYSFPRRKESLRANARVLGNGHHHHPRGEVLHINDASSTNGYHHQQGDEPLHTNGTAPGNGYHHQHTESLLSDGTGVGLRIRFTEADIERMAQEVQQETIAEVSLSQFCEWIMDSDENYELAKKYIRELKLDAGYNTDRERNPSLRELLKRTISSRPRDAHTTLAEQHAQLEELAGHSSVPMPPKTYPLIVRDEILPHPLQVSRSRAIQEAARASSFGSIASAQRDYPPNTPDRPAPLSLRSPSSTTSQLTPVPSTFPRSVSSAARNARIRNMTPLHLPRNSAIFEDTASHPLLSAPVAGTGTEDIFGPVSGDGPLTATRVGFANANANHGGTLRALEGTEADGPYELDEEDEESSLGEYDGDGFYMEEHEFSGLESYTDSSDSATPPARRMSLTPVTPFLAMFPDPPSRRVSAPVARERVDWAALPPFERTWRELNAQLLVSLYGAREVVLTQEDIEYVDGVSRRLRAGALESTAVDWTRGIFLGEPSE